jgi:hypothetical protein
MDNTTSDWRFNSVGEFNPGRIGQIGFLNQKEARLQGLSDSQQNQWNTN